MQRQTLERREGGIYVIADAELAIVCTEGSSLNFPQLIGLCFLTPNRIGWRVMLRGLADIGYTDTREEGVARLLVDSLCGDLVGKAPERSGRLAAGGSRTL